MIDDLVKETILQHIGSLKKSKKNWLTRNCMLCHTQGHSRDKRGRFGLKFTNENIAVNCFNCGFDAKWVPGDEFTEKFKLFLRELGIPDYDVKKLNFEAFKEKNKMQADNNIKLKGAVQTRWKPISLPPYTYPITTWAEHECEDKNFLNVAQYAISRNFPNLDQLYWTPESKGIKFQLNKRLLLPFKYKNKIVGYTGRFYTSTDTSKVPKYINQMPDNFIFNLDAQNDYSRKYVILNEGVFDAWITDGISPINNTISPEQIQIINNLGKIVIACPDKDKDGDEFVKVALAQGWCVSFPNWGVGIKDASQAVEKFGRILTLKSIIDSADSNPISIQVKWKLERNARDKRVYKGS